MAALLSLCMLFPLVPPFTVTADGAYNVILNGGDHGTLYKDNAAVTGNTAKSFYLLLDGAMYAGVETAQTIGKIKIVLAEPTQGEVT